MLDQSDKCCPETCLALKYTVLLLIVGFKTAVEISVLESTLAMISVKFLSAANSIITFVKVPLNVGAGV